MSHSRGVKTSRYVNNMIRSPITISGEQIYPDETYFVLYVGEQKLTKKQRTDYDEILNYPAQLQIQELYKLNPNKHPKIIPMKGIQILNYIFEQGYEPIYDIGFKERKRLTLIKKIYYEKIIEEKEG